MDDRQPIHTVYGGAHLFRADVARRLGDRALAAMDAWVPDAAALAATFGMDEARAAAVDARVRRKLATEPVEDYRADFEDGFGARSDAEEDEAAARVAAELAKGIEAGSLPPFTGIRIKPLGDATAARATRTLELVLARLAAAAPGTLPPGFAVTLPKVERSAEVATLARRLDAAESAHGLPRGSVAIELMVETPRALLDDEGRVPLRRLVDAAGGRCRGAHFGPYDHAASLGIAAAHQELRHPAGDVARILMQHALAGTGVHLADGPTTRLPVGSGPADREAVRAAMRAHWDDTRHSLRLGLWQGWDLHPAQLVPRYAAVYAFFLEQHAAAAARLRGFLEQAARATLLDGVFDDAATAQGLLAFLRRGLACGALSAEEVAAAGLTAAELRLGSFPAILAARRARG